MRLFNTFTKRTWGLDYSVWIVMLVFSLLSLGLLSYRLINYEPCTVGTISINRSSGEADNYSFYVNQVLAFNLPSPSGVDVSWDFGDQTEPKIGSDVTYQFAKAGKYQVTATIKGENSRCQKVVLVKIKDVPLAPDRYRNIKLEILGNKYTVAGATEAYNCNVVADSYQWRLVNVEAAKAQSSPSAVFTFLRSGNYLIELTLDNNPSKRIVKEITVFEKLELRDPVRETPPVLIDYPRQPPRGGTERGGGTDAREPTDIKPENREPPPVSNPKPQPDTAKRASPESPEKLIKKEVLPETFKLELDEVIALKKTPEEIAEKYLFYGGSTKVKINNGGAFKTFIEFCYQMRNSKKLRLQSVHFDKDGSGITVIYVKVKKNTLIDRVF